MPGCAARTRRTLRSIAATAVAGSRIIVTTPAPARVRTWGMANTASYAPSRTAMACRTPLRAIPAASARRRLSPSVTGFELGTKRVSNCSPDSAAKVASPPRSVMTGTSSTAATRSGRRRTLATPRTLPSARTVLVAASSPAASKISTASAPGPPRTPLSHISASPPSSRPRSAAPRAGSRAIARVRRCVASAMAKTSRSIFDPTSTTSRVTAVSRCAALDGRRATARAYPAVSPDTARNDSANRPKRRPV